MPNELTDFFNRGFQEALMSHMIRCSRFHPLIASAKITQEDFEFPYLRMILQAVYGVLRVQGTGPSIEVIPLMDQLRRVRAVNNSSPSEDDSMLRLISSAYNMPLSEHYYWSILEDYIGQMRVSAEIRKAKSRDWKTIGESFQTAMFKSKITMDEPCNPLKELDMTPEIEAIPTGILDSHIPGGGLPTKEYGILCAYTGVGKTTLALNFAWGAARAKKKACFATLELGVDKIKERLFSLIGRYDYDAIRYGRPPHQSREEVWNEVRSNVIRNSGEFVDYLQIWDFSQEVCTIPTLEEWVKREIDKDPANPPKLLIVDWLLCLDEDLRKTDVNAIKDGEARHKLQRYGDQLSKKIARKYNMAVWATHQANGDAEDQDTVTMKHSAEGKAAAWKCSMFVGVGASPESRRNGIFTATASKTRDGRTFQCKIRGELDQQRFVPITPEGEDPTPEEVRASGIEQMIESRMATGFEMPESLSYQDQEMMIPQFSQRNPGNAS